MDIVKSVKRLTLADLTARAEQRADAKPEVKLVTVASLGGGLLLEKLPVSRYMELIDSVDDEGGSFSVGVRRAVEVVYAHCPDLRARELQAAYGCCEPTDIVLRVLGDNISELMELADAAMSFYGMSTSEDELKN